jgi:hypothetical protein
MLQLNGQKIPFVNNVKYLGMIFDGRMTCRLHIERSAAKSVGAYIRTYSLFKSVHLRINIKLILNNALIRSVMVETYFTLKYVVDTHLLKLQCLQNRVLCAVSNLDRRILVRKLCVALKIHCAFYYITKLCRKQAEVIQNHLNPLYRKLNKEKPCTGSKRGLIGGNQAYDCSDV